MVLLAPTWVRAADADGPDTEYLIDPAPSGPEHALNSQCRPIAVRPTILGATVTGPAVADPTVVEPTIVCATVVLQPLWCQIVLQQRRGGDATTGGESEASDGGDSDNLDSGGRGSLDGGRSEWAGGGDRNDSDGEGVAVFSLLSENEIYNP